MESIDGWKLRIQVVHCVPEDTIDRRIQSINKGGKLSPLVVAPGRVTGFGDPDLGFRPEAIENLAHASDVAGPAFPVGLADDRKRVHTDGVGVLQQVALTHEPQPVWVDR